MENINDIITQNINLKGYGTSKFWIGFIERNKPFSFSVMNKIIAYFLEYFKDYIKDICVGVSYFRIKNLHNYYDKNDFLHLKSIENELTKLGFIKEIEKDYLSLEDDTELEKVTENLEKDFHIVTNVSKNLIKDLSIMGMADDNIYGGHCFFIIRKLNLIIYPHDDSTGYGLIGIGSKENQFAIDFLKSCKEVPFLNSYIGYRK